MENNNKNRTEVECFPSAMPAQDLARHISGPRNNEEVLLRTGSRKLADTVAERRFRMAGHIYYSLHLPGHRPSKVAMSWTPDDGRRRRGRPKKTWRRTFQKDLTRANITWEEAEYRGSSSLASSCCPMCLLAREELSLSKSSQNCHVAWIKISVIFLHSVDNAKKLSRFATK